MTERAPPEKVTNGCSILDELVLCALDNLGKQTRHIFNMVVHCRKIHDIVQGIRARNDALSMDYRRITQLKIERPSHVTEAKQGTPGNVPGVRVVASVIKVVYRGSNSRTPGWEAAVEDICWVQEQWASFWCLVASLSSLGPGSNESAAFLCPSVENQLDMMNQNPLPHLTTAERASLQKFPPLAWQNRPGSAVQTETAVIMGRCGSLAEVFDKLEFSRRLSPIWFIRMLVSGRV
ncbi:hypothetical protein C8J56DRAFT_894862 [Mycena floridula]|nr:hypothetical protein C8J56DRAFT_894862 [Mycena floridula]